MAKFFGPIGFVRTMETKPGVWENVATECNYYGDVIETTYGYQSTDQVNDNVTISNKIEIVADSFARANIGSMRYLVYLGAKWKITNVAVRYPRLILTTGGLYNGKSPSKTT